MKANILLIFSFLLMQAARAQSLIIAPKKTHTIGKESPDTLRLDMLRMGKGALLKIEGKKSFTLMVKEVIVEGKSTIAAHDGENNGTNLNLSGTFTNLNGLIIDLSGKEFKADEKKFSNGNGGNLCLAYNGKGLKPQLNDKRQSNYVTVLTKGAGKGRTPSIDVQNALYDATKRGVGGRLGGPGGKVFDATVGKDGTVEIQEQ